MRRRFLSIFFGVSSLLVSGNLSAGWWSNVEATVSRFVDVSDDGRRYADLEDNFILDCFECLEELQELPTCLYLTPKECIEQRSHRMTSRTSNQHLNEKKLHRHIPTHHEVQRNHISAYFEKAQALNDHLESKGVFLFIDIEAKCLRFFFTDKIEGMGLNRFSFSLPSKTKIFSPEIIDFPKDGAFQLLPAAQRGIQLEGESDEESDEEDDKAQFSQDHERESQQTVDQSRSRKRSRDEAFRDDDLELRPRLRGRLLNQERQSQQREKSPLRIRFEGSSSGLFERAVTTEKKEFVAIRTETIVIGKESDVFERMHVRESSERVVVTSEQERENVTQSYMPAFLSRWYYRIFG